MIDYENIGLYRRVARDARDLDQSAAALDAAYDQIRSLQKSLATVKSELATERGKRRALEIRNRH